MSYRQPGYRAYDDDDFVPNDAWTPQRAAPPKEARYLTIGGIAALALFVAVAVGTCSSEEPPVAAQQSYMEGA